MKKREKIKERHWGISVLAVLGYIGAVILLIVGLLLIAASSKIISYISEAEATPDLAAVLELGPSFFVAVGLALVIFAVIDFLVARGLWNGKNWARITAIVFSAISILSSLRNLNIVQIILDGLIIWYLGFYKPAVAYFK